MGVQVDEEILAKTGPELFRELIRVYPVAEYEDYFKNGAWKDDLMRTDLVLIYAHAREAGAPYPPALKDVKLPDLPKGIPLARPTLPGGALNATAPRPIVATAVVKPPVAAAATAPAAAQTAATAPAAAPAATAAANGAAMQATELRLIALFIAKWKLDANRTKLMLAKLTPPRRRYVIQSFKNTAGGDPTAALEEFIAKCEQTNAWATAAAPAAATTQPAGSGPQAAGIKRPLTPTMSTDPSKRPRLMTPGAVTPPKLGAVPPIRPNPKAAGVAAGMRPAGLMPRAVRPPGARPTLVTPRF